MPVEPYTRGVKCTAQNIKSVHYVCLFLSFYSVYDLVRSTLKIALQRNPADFSMKLVLSRGLHRLALSANIISLSQLQFR